MYVPKKGDPLPEGMFEVSQGQKDVMRAVLEVVMDYSRGDTQKSLIVLEAALGFTVASVSKPEKIDDVLDTICRNVRTTAHMILDQTKGDK